MQKSKRYPMQVLLESDNSAMTCGAQTRSGAPCRNRPVAGKQRCRMHGGASLSGEQHWNYKHGFYTKKEKRARVEKTAIMRILLKEFNF